MGTSPQNPLKLAFAHFTDEESEAQKSQDLAKVTALIGCLPRDTKLAQATQCLMSST